MKKTCYLLTLLILTLSAGMTRAQKITILGTNDTHSQIDPDERGRSGALQRKAVIDSVRKADKNVLLVDAGDAVQGSLYFKFFKGDVESKLMDMMGYDIRVLGNHEFDNGMEELANTGSPSKAGPPRQITISQTRPSKGSSLLISSRPLPGARLAFSGLTLTRQAS